MREAEDGLVHEVELAQLDGMAQVVLELDALGHLVRIDSSNTATESRPASLAWYMAVSASRTRTSTLASGSSPEAKARPMLAET